MEQIELSASKRDILGKKVRFLRRQGLTPANLYGHSIESTALQMETAHLRQTLAKAGKSSLIALKLDGTKRPIMVVARDIQRHPLTRELLHVDLYQVRMEEKMKLEVPIVLTGEAPAIREHGGILVQNMDSLEVECLPANMPRIIEVDVSVLTEIDQAIHVKDLHVDEGVTILTNPEGSIAQITRSRVEAEIAMEKIAAAVKVEAEAVPEKVVAREEKAEVKEAVEKAPGSEAAPKE